jgi:hypothetical protein
LPDHGLDSVLDTRELPAKQEADETPAKWAIYFFFAVFEALVVQNTKPNPE